MERFFGCAAGVFGFLGVALGAFGAHGLTKKLAGAADEAKRLGWWHTAAQYHLMHALALAFAAYLVSRGGGSAATTSGIAFMAGIVIFSGSLYTMTITNIRVLGAITPIGGLALLVGWASAAVAAWKSLSG